MDPDKRAKKILALLHERVRLAPLHRWIFYLTFGAVWLSGGLWLGAEWFKDPDLGPVRTPLQAVAMKVHGAAMLVYLAMLGTLWLHIRRGFALQVNRWSGSVVIAVNAICL